MAEKTHKLQIHCTNVFHPKPLGITHIALQQTDELIAVVRKPYFKNDQENAKIRNIEIYRTSPKLVLIHSFVEYEYVTGIDWLSKDLLVTVNLEGEINIHSIKTGERIFSTITDYGSITCMKLSLEHNLLLTGTEFGYLATYCIGEKCKSIEPLSKMVKINQPITFVDLHIKAKAEQDPPAKPKVIPNKPTKRKKTATSDGESESDDEDSDDQGEFMSDYNMMIFGASGGDIVVWDYHKKTIIDTVHIGGEDVTVNTLLALTSGEVVAGDSSGTVSVIDTNTFTCRYSTNISPASVLCLIKSSDESSLYVSGQDSAIIILKRDKSNRDEYRLKEKIEAHTNRVTSLIHLNKNKFLSGSLEGFLTRYKRAKDNRLERDSLGPNYSNEVSYFDGEMMCNHHKSLVIWKLQKTDRDTSDPSLLTNLEPNKVITIKTKNYIQSCVFNDKYVVYSGPYGLNVLRRESPDQATLCHSDKSLPKCTRLILCGDYLVACNNNDLTVIELNKEHDVMESCKVVAKHSLKSIVQHLVHMNDLHQLIIACGPIKNLIYRLDLNPESAEPFGILDKMDLSDCHISHMVPSSSGKRVYIYTDTDKILRIDVSSSALNESKIQKRLEGRATIQGLPKDAHILGMIYLTMDYVILYDSSCMYKVDLSANEIINLNSSSYNQIVALDNRAFGDPQDVALVELKLDDYRLELPSYAPPKRKRH